MQRCRLGDYPEYLTELSDVVPVPADAVTIDYLIGDPARTGQGLGPRLISAMVERTWHDFPHAPAVIVAVVAANRASWRALEKSGATRIGTGHMKPDNPVDDPTHHVYRFDRPNLTHPLFVPRPTESEPRPDGH